MPEKNTKKEKFLLDAEKIACHALVEGITKIFKIAADTVNINDPSEVDRYIRSLSYIATTTKTEAAKELVKTATTADTPHQQPSQPSQPSKPSYGKPSQPSQSSYGKPSQPTQPSQPSYGKPSQPTQPSQPSSGKLSHHYHQSSETGKSTRIVCYYCYDPHFLFDCDKIPPKYRGYCIRCWSSKNHQARECNSNRRKEPWM